MKKNKITIIILIAIILIFVVVVIVNYYLTPGNLIIKTNYENITVRINNDEYNNINYGYSISLKPGKYIIYLKINDHLEKKQEINIKPNRSTELETGDFELEYDDSQFEELKLPEASGI